MLARQRSVSVRRARRIAPLLAAALLACTSSPPSHSSPNGTGDWLEIRAPHFTILGDLAPERLREWATELALFDTLTRKSTEASTLAPQSAPVRIYVFRQLADARAFMSVGWAAGELLATQNAHFAVLSDEGPVYATRETLYHEYVHHILRRDGSSAYPKWYDEGMSSYLGTLRVRDDAIIIGTAPAGYLTILAGEGLVPLADLLDASRLEDLRAGPFYASSWALVHYLHAKSANRARLGRFVRESLRGLDWRSAYESSFDRTLETLQADVQTHIDHLLRGARYDFALSLASIEVATRWEEVSTPYEQVARELERARSEVREDDTHSEP